MFQKTDSTKTVPSTKHTPRQLSLHCQYGKNLKSHFLDTNIRKNTILYLNLLNPAILCADYKPTATFQQGLRVQYGRDSRVG